MDPDTASQSYWHWDGAEGFLPTMSIPSCSNLTYSLVRYTKTLMFNGHQNILSFYSFKNHLDLLPKVYKVCTTLSLYLTGLQI